MSTENEQAAEVLRGLIKGWAYSLPESHQWRWLREEMLLVAGEATAASVNDAGIDVETRSLKRVDGRAGRTKDAEERTRWAVVVEDDAEEMASEFRSVNTTEEGACREARILRDVLQKRGRKASVAAVEVVERRRTVQTFATCSPIDKSSDLRP